MKNKKLITSIIGITAIIMLLLLLLLSDKLLTPNSTNDSHIEPSGVTAEIIFNDELVYDGKSPLNLLSGIKAVNSDGKDVTDTVSSVITSDGSLFRKTVRYSFSDIDGKTVTKLRTLKMKNYKGPSLSFSKSVYLDSSDLNDIISALKNKAKLSAKDGYGNDISSNVKVLREHINGNRYMINISVSNAFNDSKSAKADAFISGTVINPKITLVSNSINLNLGDYFAPQDVIAEAFDGMKNAIDRVEIHSAVNTNLPGCYNVSYKLYSADKTAVTRKNLKVNIIGE